MIPQTKTKKALATASKIATANVNGFPDSITSVHRYSQYVNLDAGMGAVTKQVFRANSMYDPDLTGTGHQPMGRDEMSALYGHYCVDSARISVSAMPFGSTNYPAAYGLILDDDGTVANDAHQIIEQANGKYVVFQNNYLASKAQSQMTATFDAKRFFHLDSSRDVKYEIGAQVGSNPADGAYFVLWVGPLDGSSDLNGVGFEVLIEYTVTWTERSTMVQS